MKNVVHRKSSKILYFFHRISIWHLFFVEQIVFLSNFICSCTFFFFFFATKAIFTRRIVFETINNRCKTYYLDLQFNNSPQKDSRNSFYLLFASKYSSPEINVTEKSVIFLYYKVKYINQSNNLKQVITTTKKIIWDENFLPKR